MVLPGKLTRNLFFTGKGGVGKTSVASATAVGLADAGKRVLLVSTDPASNLDEVFGVELGMAPTPVPGVANLYAMNIDPEAAAHAYRERMVSPYRGVLPEASVRSMEEQFSGACTMEIAAFDEFSKLLGDVSATAEFDHVLFDTAPTGHTLRLLQLPAAWTVFFGNNVGGNSCLGPLAGLTAQRALYEAALKALADGEVTTLVLVSRPERTSLREADRSSRELSKLGIKNQRLVLNGIFASSDPRDATAVAMEARGRSALAGTAGRPGLPAAFGGDAPALRPRGRRGLAGSERPRRGPRTRPRPDGRAGAGRALAPAGFPHPRADPPGAWRHHDDGQGRGREDHRRHSPGRHPRPARPQGASLDHGPGGPSRPHARLAGPEPHREPHRPGPRDRRVHGRGDGEFGQGP